MTPEYRKTVKVPLIGSLQNRGNPNGTPDSALEQRFLNCFPVVYQNALTGASRLVLAKRKGLTGVLDSTNLPLGTWFGTYGALTWTGKSTGTNPDVLSYWNSGASTVKIYDATASSPIGSTITGTACTSITETVVGGTSNLVAVIYSAGQQVWYFPEGGAWTQITDGDFPSANIRGEPAHLDGYMFILDKNGKIWNSDLGSLSSWSATSFIDTQIVPDGGVGLVKHHNMIAAFGVYSIEFFKDAGNAVGSPLVSVPEYAQKIGALPKVSETDDPLKTIHSHENDVYFLSGGGSESGRRGIYRLRDFKVEKISNNFIDLLMNSSTTSVKGIVGSFTMLGYDHIMFRGSSSDDTYCYTPETNTWWVWFSGWGLLNSCIGKNLQSRFAPGAISYIIQVSSSYTDITNFPMTIQTQPLDFDSNKRKFFHRLDVVGDTMTTAGNLSVSWSDDDYANFSTAVGVDMTAQTKRVNNLGASRRRAFKFTESINRPLRLEAFEVTYSEGIE